MGDKAEPLFVERVAQIVAATLARNVEIDAEMAAIVGDAVAAAVSEEYGGGLIYVSKGWAAKARAKHAQIYAEFTGSNVKELARRHKISVIWCYEIIKRMRKQYVAERQSDLFGAPEPPG